jgi:hypothetical protein
MLAGNKAAVMMQETIEERLKLSAPPNGNDDAAAENAEAEDTPPHVLFWRRLNRFDTTKA